VDIGQLEGLWKLIKIFQIIDPKPECLVREAAEVYNHSSATASAIILCTSINQRRSVTPALQLVVTSIAEDGFGVLRARRQVTVL
jgi:hypothetical protein